MSTKARNQHRPTRLIESRVTNKGNRRRQIKSAQNVRRVVCLARALPAISQCTIAQLKTQSTQRQVFAMLPREPTIHKRTPNAIRAPMPRVARQVSSKRHFIVHFSQAERFVMTVVPAPARINPEILRKILFEVNAKSGFHRTRMPMHRDVWSGIFSAQKGIVGFSVIPQISMTDKAEQTQVRAISLEGVGRIIKFE